MSNFIEYNDKIAFHPGYYIEEIVDESGLTQEDFAKRLDTTPKNLSILIRGKQNLSIEMAVKLSRMTDTSVSYWLNLQNAYDTLVAEFKSDEELVEERRIFKYLDYRYFRKHFNLPDLPRKTDEQIKALREFLNVSTLSVFSKKDMAVSFRSSTVDLSEGNITRANVMVQIAANKALEIEAPRFDKKEFESAVEYALTLTERHDSFYPLIYNAFLNAGVIFIVLPNIDGSKTNGATKKVGEHIMLMVNDRRLFADSFWFTLFHEIGHIMIGDYGISFEKESGKEEEIADKYAEDRLIPPLEYQEFLSQSRFDVTDIIAFAKKIGRDPGIVLGRLENDAFVRFDNRKMSSLRHRYRVITD